MDLTQKKVNVGLFIDSFFPMVDGVIMVVDNYAKRLCKYCNVTVFTVKSRGYKKYKRDYPYKVVQCRKIPIPFLDYDLPRPRSDRTFMRELEASNLDIVHIHSPFSIGKVGINYAYKHKIPVIANLHSQFEMDFMRATKSKLLTSIMLKNIVSSIDKCDEFYATNEAFAKVFLRYGLSHIPLIQQNGTDLMPIKQPQNAIKRVNIKYGLVDDMTVFLFVGRINKLKNIYFLLKALMLLKNKRFKMIFVGDGRDKRKFEKKVMDSPIRNNVIFTGRITDRKLLAALYLRAKLFLFPSLYDTNSLVQIEAASQKTPTLFIKGSVTSDTVTDNVNGFISDPTPKAYACKIEEILSNRELYDAVSEAAFTDLYVNWDTCVNQIYKRYLDHIKSHKKECKTLI